MPRFDFTLHAQAHMKGYFSVEAQSIEDAKAKMAQRFDHVHWLFQDLNEDCGVTAEVDGPARYGEESVTVEITPPKKDSLC